MEFIFSASFLSILEGISRLTDIEWLIERCPLQLFQNFNILLLVQSDGNSLVSCSPSPANSLQIVCCTGRKIIVNNFI